MRGAVIDIRGNRREKLGKFLIAIYILNIIDLIFTKFLLWKVPCLFNDVHMFFKASNIWIRTIFFKDWGNGIDINLLVLEK